MTKKNPIETIEHAKEYSIIKWKSVIADLGEVLNSGGQSCGFCLHIAQENNGCQGCVVTDKCNELDIKFFAPANEALDYLVNDLIPFIENFQGETKQ